jgi:hypothetical protein
MCVIRGFLSPVSSSACSLAVVCALFTVAPTSAQDLDGRVARILDAYRVATNSKSFRARRKSQSRKTPSAPAPPEGDREGPSLTRRGSRRKSRLARPGAIEGPPSGVSTRELEGVLVSPSSSVTSQGTTGGVVGVDDGTSPTRVPAPRLHGTTVATLLHHRSVAAAAAADGAEGPAGAGSAAGIFSVQGLISRCALWVLISMGCMSRGRGVCVYV